MYRKIDKILIFLVSQNPPTYYSLTDLSTGNWKTDYIFNKYVSVSSA